MKKIILLLALGFLCQPLYPQRTEYPQIGAQVFIEPGQTDKQIDGFFRILAQHGFETARIRMFGAHMLRPDGSWDFTLYDKAFDAAGKHGVKLFATLFPPTDELGDVGGFKFPRSKAHLLEIAGYIEAVVSHFRGHPALDTWVLQNEPGTGGTGPGRNDLTDEVFARWKAAQKTPAYDNGYLKADFTQERFHTDFTTWYLGWIASQVDLHDPAHHKHINPHQLLDNLADYDFPAYEGFLTSLGVSMHPGAIPAGNLAHGRHHPLRSREKPVLDHRNAGRQCHGQRKGGTLPHGTGDHAMALDGYRRRRRRGDLLDAEPTGVGTRSR